MASSPKIYQFKITLKEVKPIVWRRIQVPETYSFFGLHRVIQEAMGWGDAHLHQFEMKHPQTGAKILIGEPLPEYPFEVIEEKSCQILTYFVAVNDKALYEYDFGDGWEHNIVLERILSREANVEYPRCVAGRRACPPCCCGGVWGYEELLKIIADPNHEEHAERMDWLGMQGYDQFDPAKFDLSEAYMEHRDEFEVRQ